MNARHVRRAGARRRVLGLAVVGAAGVLGVAATASAGVPTPPNGEGSKDKVTICHATSSWTNPYNEIEVSTNSIINQVSGKVQGHGKDKDDVIPGFSIPRQSPPNPEGLIWTFPGMNMPEGQKLLDNHCFPLDVVKTGTPTVLPGGTIKYQVAVTNVGLESVPFGAVSVYDKYVKLNPPDVTTAMKPGETRVWTGERKVYDSLKMCGKGVKNTATVTLQKMPREDSLRRKRANGEDPVGDSSSWTTNVLCPLDVGITKTSTQTGVEPGGTITYTVRVTNPGPIPLPTGFLSVADPGATTLTPPAEMPKELKQGEFLDWTATKVLAADNALCNTNAENTASVTVMPPVNGQKPSAKAENGGSWMPNYTSWPKDPVSATATPILISGGTCPPVTPSSTPVSPAAAPVSALRPAGPALSVDKTGPVRALRGGFASYRVTVTNTGGATATGVTLSDTPARAMRWRAVPAGSTVSGTTATWAIGDLAAGQSVSKVVRFRMSTSASGRVCNTAVAAATGLESVRDRACTTIVAARRPATPVTG